MVQGYESSNMSQAMEGMSRRKKMIVRIMTYLVSRMCLVIELVEFDIQAMACKLGQA
jgi:hypothetical protein